MAAGNDTTRISGKYDSLPDSDFENVGEFASDTPRRFKTSSRIPWRALCMISSILNVIFVAGIIFQLGVLTVDTSKAPSDYPQPIFESRLEYRQMWNHNSGSNYTQNSMFWDSLLPGHGVVVVDRAWAAEKNWIESVHYPKDHSKGVYALEAYHQLHCLVLYDPFHLPTPVPLATDRTQKNIRKTFWEAHDGEEISWPQYHEHMEHCFESLRQSIMCTADNSALFTYGGDTIGHGQLRQCRSWEQLRDWATQNSACYLVDPTPMPLKERFDFCDDGFDGMVYRE